jgi:hypothetical protein
MRRTRPAGELQQDHLRCASKLSRISPAYNPNSNSKASRFLSHQFKIKANKRIKIIFK